MHNADRWNCVMNLDDSALQLFFRTINPAKRGNVRTCHLAKRPRMVHVSELEDSKNGTRYESRAFADRSLLLAGHITSKALHTKRTCASKI